MSGDTARLPQVFDRIDHVGVAVEQIEPALELWRDGFKLDVAHREVVREQGVEAVLLDVGENHIELLAPLGPDTPVGKFLAKRGPGLHHVAYQVPDIDAALAELGAGGDGADRQGPPPRHRRHARRLPGAEGHRTGADRDRRTGPRQRRQPARRSRRRGGPLMPASIRVSVGFQGGQTLALRVSDVQLQELHGSLGAGGWHELQSEDGPVRLDLAQVVYVRAESDDQRVGFGA